jgi:colicin import membrane protein
MTTYSFETEKKYQITARSVATVFGIMFLILFFFNLLTYQDPKPGQAGILVSFGQPNIGQGEEVSAPAPAAAEEEKVEEETQAEVSEPEEVVPEEAEPEVTKPDPVKPEKTTPKKDVVEDARSKEIALKKKQEDEKKRQEEIAKRAEELEAKKKADAAKKAKAEADAKKAAEAKAKQDAADKLKGEIGGLFGQDGDGKGNTGTSGNQGDPNGDPNASNLDGISTGSGMVGGGLGNRGGAGPSITDKSQATGTVVVKVCVDSNGKVISAKYTQSGSNTTDTQLRRLAEENAMKWKFKSATIDGNQCGTITYNFKVK